MTIEEALNEWDYVPNGKESLIVGETSVKRPSESLKDITGGD